MIRWSMAAAVGMVLVSGAAAYAAGEEKTMLEKATPEQQKLFGEAKPMILKEAAQKPLILGKSNESYFWVMSARMVPLVKAYHYSHDTAFLEAFVPIMEQVLSQRYVHPTKPEWSGWFEYDPGEEVNFRHLALIDHDTILYYVPVLMFVQEVRADPKLKEKYGQKAEKWMKDVEASIRGWDKRGCWHDFPDGSGWYSCVTQYPDPKTGELKKLDVLGAGGVVPYNKVHALFEALSLAYRLTGDEWYRGRMEKCCKFFRAHWRQDDKHVEWNYRDHAFAGDYESGVLGQGKTRTGAFVHPKGGYYALDVEGVVRAWDLGGFYKKEDIDKLIKTNLEFMWMGDEKDPRFKMISGGYKAEEKYYKGYLWTSLAHFSPKVRELWKTQIELGRAAKQWMWWSNALDYLTEMSRPVSWDHRDKPAGNGGATQPAKGGAGGA